jgi:hypothetical protein
MKWTTILYHVIQFLAVCAGIYNYKRLVKPTKVLFWLMVYTFISELVALYIQFNIGNNVYIYHLYNPIQYSLVTYAFYLELRQYRFMLYSIFLFWVFALVNGIYWEPFLTMFCANLSMTKSILTTLWIFLYFYELLKNVNEYKFLHYPLVWVSIGLLIFNANLVGLGLFNLLNQYDPITLALSNVRSFTNYVLYSSFIGAFFCHQNLVYK